MFSRHSKGHSHRHRERHKSSSSNDGSKKIPDPELDPGDPTVAELHLAATTTVWALQFLGVFRYGFIGGGAVSMLSAQNAIPPRQTGDLDLIIQPTNTTAEQVSAALTENPAVNQYFVAKYQGYAVKPHVLVQRTDSSIAIPIEIFDYQVWPHREQYYNLDRVENIPELIMIHNQPIGILTTSWLLRQKILTFAQRQNRAGNDVKDINTLWRIMRLAEQPIVITDPMEIEALRTTLVSPLVRNLRDCVICEEVWPTYPST